MKKNYVKPEAEFINFYSEEEITSGDTSAAFGEGFTPSEDDKWD